MVPLLRNRSLWLVLRKQQREKTLGVSIFEIRRHTAFGLDVMVHLPSQPSGVTRAF